MKGPAKRTTLRRTAKRRTHRPLRRKNPKSEVLWKNPETDRLSQVRAICDVDGNGDRSTEWARYAHSASAVWRDGDDHSNTSDSINWVDPIHDAEDKLTGNETLKTYGSEDQ
jgi:hypothetical protein